MFAMNQSVSFAPPEVACAAQYGALCWRLHRGKVEVLLITSRDTGRWVIPKGWPMKGMTPSQAAAREAWEEAGVQGEAEAVQLGSFTYDKTMAPKPPIACAVEVFPLRVKEMKSRFPERKQRRRKWFAAEKAARKVAEVGLRALILSLAHTPAEDGAEAKLARP
jgi:8-oxo-dGTP pyrophosphatase MutT (NUDIX family)